jgi:hypothetical protein
MDESSAKKIDLMKDHDILTTLVEKVNNLASSQNNFHEEVRNAFKRLEDNYSSRIDALDVRTKRIENESFYVKGALALIGVIIAMGLYIYFNAQEVQDKRVDGLVQQIRDLK